MSATEQTETIEFLKIRLMQRDREISDFEAKMKKTQFKHSRDLKEAKMGEDRAKTLLKEQKTKVDKFSKASKQAQQQVLLLNLRLTELRQQKQKQVSEVRAQYNSLKDQLRSYERILPTLTFMKDMGLKIETMNSYQDIFLREREKSAELKETKEMVKNQRKRFQEEIKTVKQNQELMRTKKLQIEKTLKDMIPKILDYQQQISDLKSHSQQQSVTIEELTEQIHHLQQKNSSLQSTVRQYQLKLQQLDRAYSQQLLAKEEQIHALTQEQFANYQEEIRSLEHRLEIKEEMYIKQVRIYEDEVYFLQGRINEEKQHFQENYITIKKEIQRMTCQIQRERGENQWLKGKNEQIVKEISRMAQGKENLQVKVEKMQKVIDQYREEQLKNTKSFSDVQLSKMQNLQRNYNELMQKYESATMTIDRLQDENRQLNEENVGLRAQITNKNTPKPHPLELPPNLFQYVSPMMKKAEESDRVSEGQIMIMPVCHEEIGKDSQANEGLAAALETMTKEKEELKNQAIKLTARNQQQQTQIVILKTGKDSLLTESISLRQRLRQLSQQLSDKDIKLATLTKNLNLVKSKAESSQKQLSRVLEDNKKEKQLIKALRQQVKNAKQTTSMQADKSIRDRKELNNQFETLKAERDRIKTQYSGRERAITQELQSLRNTLKQEKRYQNLVEELTKENQKYQEEQKMMSERLKQLQRQLSDLQKDKEALTEDIKTKQRQIQKLSESLARQRKERTLLTVPSLGQIDKKGAQSEQTFNNIYSLVTQKQSQINFLQRQVSDLREEIDSLKMTSQARMQAMEAEQNDYIQTIIEMKMRCAESQMKAAESQHLYSKLKKKIQNKH